MKDLRGFSHSTKPAYRPRFDLASGEGPQAPLEPSPTETALDFDFERTSYAGPFSRVPADALPPVEAPSAGPSLDETSLDLDFDFEHGDYPPSATAEAITVEELPAEELLPAEALQAEMAVDFGLPLDATEGQPLEDGVPEQEIIEAITLPELPELPDEMLTVDEALEALETETETEESLEEESLEPAGTAPALEPEAVEPPAVEGGEPAADDIETEPLLDAFDAFAPEST